jgi:hypothetical protein
LQPSLRDSLAAKTKYLVMTRHAPSVQPLGENTGTVLLQYSSFSCSHRTAGNYDAETQSREERHAKALGRE